MTDERERGTWDQLLLTPITTKEIVRGKFWGLLRAFLPYVVVYAVATLPLAFLIGAEAFVVCSIVTGMLALGAPYIVAVGLYCSAHLRTSWRSLLAAVGACYAYLVAASLLSSAACMLGFFVRMMLMVAVRPALEDIIPDVDILIGGLAGTFTMLVLNAMVLGPIVWALILWTEARVEKAERARVSPADRRHQKVKQIAADLAREEPV